MRNDRLVSHLDSTEIRLQKLSLLLAKCSKVVDKKEQRVYRLIRVNWPWPHQEKTSLRGHNDC